MKRVPPVPALNAFEAAVRLRSIRRAGAELSLSHTVVGRHIRNLEAMTGTKLLIAGPSGVEPTPEGMRYHYAVATALDLIATATADLRPTAGHGEIRIACAAGLARRWLTRRLPALARVLHPVEIVLLPSDRAPDFTHREADLAISYGAIPDAGLRSEILAHPRIFPVASPAFLAACGPLEALEDLARQSLLHEDSKEQWRLWFELAGLQSAPRLAGPRLRYADLTVEAALQNQGIALASEILAGPELAEGRLVECGRSAVLLEPYVLQAPPPRWDDSTVRRLRNWLKREMAGAAIAPEPPGAEKAPPL